MTFLDWPSWSDSPCSFRATAEGRLGVAGLFFFMPCLGGDTEGQIPPLLFDELSYIISVSSFPLPY